MRRPRWGPGRRAATAPVLVLAVALGSTLTGCTDDEAPARSGGPRPTVTAPAPDLSRRAAPYRVRLTTVAGELPRSRRGPYLRTLAAPVRSWVDEAFVRGPWPRHRFTAAYTPFSRDLTRWARREGDLLTLRVHGPAVQHVVPERRWVALSGTVVGGRVIGATARVNLRFRALRDGGRRVLVHVRGDLFLTRTRTNGWQIFGYDVDRWEDRGAMTAGATGRRARRGGGR